jgi:hypothetical protein
LTYPQLGDDGGHLARQLGVEGVPTTLFLNALGRLRARPSGRITARQFAAGVDLIISL